MKRTLLLSAAAATGLALTAAAETRTYDMPAFDGIDVSAGLTLIFEASAEQSIVAETERGDFDKLSVKVEDGTLYLGRERSGWGWGGNRRNKFTITVSGPAISELEATSGSNATANGFQGDYIELEASSGASLRASGIVGGDVEIDASSGASLSAEGDCGRITIDSSSGASINARSLLCQHVTADASSGSSISAYATESVVGDASSGASVNVSGGATDVRTDKSSGGSVSVS